MYGEDRNIRLFVGLGLVILLLFVAIFLIINSGGSDNKDEVTETKRSLTSYASDPDVTVTQHIVGPIVAAERHSQLEINVSNSSTTANRISGYDGNVTGSQTYPMTTASFSEFLNAIDRAGFTLGSTDKELENDEGFCPTGKRYIYTVRDGSKVVQRFWATSCGGTKSYKGNLGQTITLFQRQVPEYGTLMRGSGL